MYIVALPAFGIVSDLLSTHARRNIFGYRMMVWAILAIGCLSFVVWAHHMYVSGMNPYFGFFFATTTLIIAVPTAIKVYNWVLTLWRGDIHLTVPMLFAIGFIFTFINGGLTGLFLGNVTVDVPLSGTYFVVAHFHMVMGVSPILVVFGAIYHWYPKITGRMLDDTLGKIHFWCTFLGTYAIYLPMHYLGILGVPRRYYAYSDSIDFIPPVGAHRERVDHDLGGVRRRRAAGLPVQPGLVAAVRPRRPGRIPGARRRSNGRRRTRRRSTATGARICRSCIAGRTTTACPVRRRTSFRRTCRPAMRAIAGGPRSRSAASESDGRLSARCVDRHRRLADPGPQAVGEVVGSAARRRRARVEGEAPTLAARRASVCGCSSRSSPRCSACSSPRTTCAWVSAHGAERRCSDWIAAQRAAGAVAQHAAADRWPASRCSAARAAVRSGERRAHAARHCCSAAC